MPPTGTNSGSVSSAEKRIALFYKGCPYPAQSGLQRRVLEIIRGFWELGGKVTLFSTNRFSETPWCRESVRWLRAHGAENVEVYESTRLDRLFDRLMVKVDSARAQKNALFSAIYTPPGLRWWLARRLRTLRPHLTMMVYAMWDGLLTGSRRSAGILVIDTIDLVSLNTQMRLALEQRATVTADGFDQFDNAALDEQFYDRCDGALNAREFQIYDRYDFTCAISECEAETIQQHVHKTRVLYLPMTEEARPIENQYDGAALFTMGDNLFNRQACQYFAHRVLPSILTREPNFQLDITGSGRASLPSQNHITHRGFMPDLEEIYRHARFFVCPVFGGTGQLIKVIEAMAYGLAVIILKAAQHRAPVEHGVNGFIALDAREFADYTTTLWKDRELCRLMGAAAQKTVSENFSRQRLRTTLSILFDS